MPVCNHAPSKTPDDSKRLALLLSPAKFPSVPVTWSATTWVLVGTVPAVVAQPSGRTGGSSSHYDGSPNSSGHPDEPSRRQMNPEESPLRSVVTPE